MKTLAPFRSIAFAVLFLGHPQFLIAQKEIRHETNFKRPSIENVINSREFIFKPWYAIPIKGKSRAVSSHYEMIVTPDSVFCDLPYYGRIYSPGLTASKCLRFRSAHYSYQSKPGKNGEWDVTIKPKGTEDVSQLLLSVTGNGHASMHATFSLMDAITFKGTLYPEHTTAR
jgi:Domain of unknown function (DUF4251)